MTVFASMPQANHRALWTLVLLFVGLSHHPGWSAVPEPASRELTPVAQVEWSELVAYGPRAERAPFINTGHRLLDVVDREISGSSVSSPAADALATPLAVAMAPTVTNSFLGLDDSNSSIPPDTHGAVGPNHVMTMLNTQVRVQDRSGNVISTTSLAGFWSPAAGFGRFDPRIKYDAASGRWVATCDSDSRSPSSRVLFAISDTDDPTGIWTFYAIDADPTDVNWCDFPDIGFNNTWITISNNMFTVAADAFSGGALWVLDKADALAGGSVTITYFAPGFDLAGGSSGGTMRVCETFGSEPKLYLMDRPGVTSGGVQTLRLSEITGTGPSPAWNVTAGSVIAGSGLFPVTNNFHFSLIDAAQLGTTTRIETNDPRLQNAVFRNGRIWTAHSGGLPVGASDRTAVFWYQIDPTAMPAPIVQSGLFDGGVDVHHFFPAITANKSDDAFIGFSRSDAGRFAEAVYASRSSGDALGTMAAIAVLKAGEDSYVKDFSSGRVRWGDYSATVVDPTDDLSFWTLQEYAALDVGPGPSDDRWGTWWGQAVVQEDVDGDGVLDSADNCVFAFNPLQEDGDFDGVGDSCDVCPGFDDTIDSDGDSVPDACDICPGSSDLEDADGDGVPNGCDICPNGVDSVDTDSDGVPDDCDLCPGFDDNLDADGDTRPDLCDNCPATSNPFQFDTDADGVGDSCDVCQGFDDAVDTDGDSVPDGCDICAGGDDNVDTDSDGVPDLCDACPGSDDHLDADGDSVPDGCDICPGGDDTADADSDGAPDFCDACAGFDDFADSDGDTVADSCDNCPVDPNPLQEDSDGDGLGDACDCPILVTGDASGEGSLASNDIILMVNFVFKSGPAPAPCQAVLDVNCDGVVTSSDIIFMVNFVFKSGAPPCDVCTLVPGTWSCP